MPSSVNPTTGDTLREYPEMPIPELCAIIDKTGEAQRAWRNTSFGERAKCLRKAAEILRHQPGYYAEMMAREMGKPVKQGRAEAEKCARVCEHYADHGADYLADECIQTGDTEARVVYDPIGVVLAIMPWNYPFWQVFRAAAPNLMAGNGLVLKHASNVPECALAIEALFQQAGFPTHLFRTLLTGSKKAAVAIVHPAVRGVTLTGSGTAGATVAAQAGTEIKKTVLELGGSDAYLILEDADIEHAARTCAASRLLNSGQSCIAAKRFIAVEAVAGAFTEAFIEAMRAYEPGDPTDPETTLGPQARTNLRDELHRQVADSVSAGARLPLGGTVPNRRGAWYPATVLTGVRPGMRAFDEETFGPVGAVITAENENDAVALANQSVFGLGGGIFTKDTARARALARRLDTGNVAINGYVKSDPRLPFGGVKQSGYGLELGAPGIREFTNTKTIVTA